VFRRKQKLDNIYNLLINFNNNERNHSVKLQTLMDNYKEDLIKVMAELKKTQELLKAKESELSNVSAASNGYYLEIQRLNRLLDEKEKESQKHAEFVRKTTEKLLDQQKEHVKKKPTRAELMAEKYYKIPDDAMSKLK